MAPLPKPIGFSSSVKNRKDKLKCYQFLCVGICLLPLPITQIVYSYMNDPLVCPGNVFPFTVNTWLYIEAATTMTMFINWVLIQMAAIHISPTAYTTRGFIAMHVLWMVFQTSWIIVGSIQFWRDCYTLQPVSVNILMWVTLIMGIIRSVGNNNQKILLIED